MTGCATPGRPPHPAAALLGALRADRPRLRDGLAILLPFGLYLRTLAPTIYNLDSAELSTAAATGGILRATGYPLYLTLGWLWTRLPIGDVGYRMNLLSAVSGAATILLADRILRRLRVGPLASAGALGLLAVAPAFWSMSLVAEVYTLQTLLMAGLILALLRWAEAPLAPGRAAGLGLLLGLALCHHAATALLLPGLGVFVAVAAPEALRRPRLWAAGVLGLAIGLTPLVYLPLRYAAAPAFNYAGAFDAAGRFQPVDLSRPAGILWLMSGRSFAGQMFGYGPTATLTELWRLLVQLNRAFLGVGLGPGLLGAVLLYRRHRPIGLLLGLFFAANGLFFAAYRVVDKATMYLPVYLVWALWAGLGYQALLDWVAGRRDRGAEPAPGLEAGQARAAAVRGRPGSSWPRAGNLLGAGLLVAVLAGLRLTWPLADRSGDVSARLRGERLLAAAEPNALVLGWWDTVPVLQYLQLVEGRRPDILAINRFLIPSEALDALLRRELGRRPIYVDSVPGSLAGAVAVSQADLFLRLRPAPPPRQGRSR